MDRTGPRRPARWRKWLTIAGGGLVGFVALGGFLHTPPGLRLMVRMGIACPVLLVSPAVANEMRMEGVRKLRGSSPAPVRPALGFALDASTADQVDAWARARGLTCTRKKMGFTQLTCGTPGAEPELTFSFGGAGTLIGVDVFRRMPSPPQALASFSRAADALHAQLGAPTTQAGEAGAAFASSQPYAFASLGYRYSDYLATISAQRLPDSLVVREQYQSARP